MSNIFKRLIGWIKLRIYEILYIALLVILSIYIINNWEICVTMTFFEQFDGNNILFLVWIVLLILTFYDVEVKGWKFRKKRIEDTRKQMQNAESDFMQAQINNLRDSIKSQFENAESNFMQAQINNLRDSIKSQNSDEMNGGSGQNE